MEHEEPAADEPRELSPREREDIEADLDDLAAMRTVFSIRGVKGVVISCQDCGSNHFYEWELIRENLEHMLEFGEPRMHEPGWDIREDEYVAWDYGKGYVDALADTGLEPERRIDVTKCPWCGTGFGDSFAFCPTCGRSLGPVRLYRELIGEGMPERDARGLLVRAGYEPF